MPYRLQIVDRLLSFWHSITRDLDEEAKLRRLAVVVRDSNDAITIQDFEGRISAWNRGAELMYGYGEEEALEMNIASLTAPTKETEQKEFTRRLTAGETVSSFESQRVTKDGRILDVWLTVTKVMDDSGKAIGIASTERDITERKRAVEALRQSNEYLEDLINCANAPIIVWDPQFRITRFNHAFESLTGRKADSVVGRSLEILFPPGGVEDATRHVRKTAGGERWDSVEIGVLNIDGSVRTVLWNSATLYLADGKTPVAIIAQGQDITERKRAERERERLNAELSRKNKELEQLLYVTTHDLRSPLVNVQGFSKELGHSLTELMSAVQQEDLPDAAAARLAPIVERDIPEALEYIQTSVSKMDSLLTGLLRLSRLGRGAVTITELDMNTLVAEVVKVHAFRIGQANVQLNSSELPPCKADATQVRQVFSNLIDNALKYLAPARPGVIGMSGQRDGGLSVYCVEDNGVGIDPSYQDKIFEMFHRLNPGRGQGEGLGLSIAKRAVERLGGTIWVESEEGKGSRFFVSLPAA